MKELITDSDIKRAEGGRLDRALLLLLGKISRLPEINELYGKSVEKGKGGSILEAIAYSMLWMYFSTTSLHRAKRSVSEKRARRKRRRVNKVYS